MDGGSLADVLMTAQLTGSGPLSEMVLGKLAARVLAGLNYLHRERHQVTGAPTRPQPGPTLRTPPPPRHRRRCTET